MKNLAKFKLTKIKKPNFAKTESLKNLAKSKIENLTKTKKSNIKKFAKSKKPDFIANSFGTVFITYKARLILN